MTGAPIAAAKSPIRMGRVVLLVHDLDGVAGFYERVIGLHRLAADAESARLGVQGDVLLELRRDAAARPRSAAEAGLFHTAFLLPGRADLGSWLAQVPQTGAALTGAADHAVSEALYLSDPEGNGIEIYADRPSTDWVWKGGQVAMTNDPLDLNGLVEAAGDEPWRGFPPGARVGHVHLQVGAIEPAETFYSGVLGLDVTCRYRGASFYAAGGYHHHLATNVWNSRGAGVRTQPSTGLAEVEILTGKDRIRATHRGPEAVAELPARATLHDPWGTAITLVAA